MLSSRSERPCRWALAGVQLVATTTSTAQRTGKSYPTFMRLCTRRPGEPAMASGDVLVVWPVKNGTLTVRPVVQNSVEREPYRARMQLLMSEPHSFGCSVCDEGLDR